MKAALNGALNLSILDGWWDEWFDGENGWAIPTADTASSDEERDDAEASALYDLIEHQLVPKFYDREGGIPLGVARDGAPHDDRARQEGHERPDGAGLRHTPLRSGRRARRRPARRRVRRARRSWRRS